MKYGRDLQHFGVDVKFLLSEASKSKVDQAFLKFSQKFSKMFHFCLEDVL